jgi:hypothetical protein
MTEPKNQGLTKRKSRVFSPCLHDQSPVAGVIPFTNENPETSEAETRPPAIQSQRDGSMSAQASGLGNGGRHNGSPNGAAILWISVAAHYYLQRVIDYANEARINHDR